MKKAKRKVESGKRMEEAGSRKPEAGSLEPSADRAVDDTVYGMRSETDRLVLSLLKTANNIERTKRALADLEARRERQIRELGRQLLARECESARRLCGVSAGGER